MAAILRTGLATINGGSPAKLAPVTSFANVLPPPGVKPGNVVIDVAGKRVSITPLGQAVLLQFGVLWLFNSVTAWFITKTAFFIAVPTTVAEWLGFKGFTFIFKLIFQRDFQEALDEWVLHYFFSIKGQQELSDWILSGKNILDFPWEKLRGSIGADP